MSENECILLTVDGVNGYFPKEFVEEAVKKQIPKKPDYEGDGYDDNGEIIYDTSYCPCCRHEFEAYYDITDYCPNCGQALDWATEKGKKMAENEYIKREVVHNSIKSLCNKYNVAYGGNSGGFAEDLEKSIINLPSADVEEVIRCKDCKYWGGRYGDNECTMITDLAKPDFWVKTLPEDFCSSAIRKSSEEKMTDNEIIKALELCGNFRIDRCKYCPCYENAGTDCMTMKTEAAILINRQKAEIERLNNKEENISIVCDRAKELYGELYEEAKEILKAKARIEAIKVFANRLKCGVSITSGIITCEDIDTLVKEMTEGGNGYNS